MYMRIIFAYFLEMKYKKRGYAKNLTLGELLAA